MIVDALAAYRLTRLVTADSITAPLRGRVIEIAYEMDPRPTADRVAGLAAAAQSFDEGDCSAFDWLVDNDPCPPRLAKLITCRWCASVWIGFGVAIARRVTPRAWRPIAEALALSAIAGLGARLE